LADPVPNRLSTPPYPSTTTLSLPLFWFCASLLLSPLCFCACVPLHLNSRSPVRDSAGLGECSSHPAHLPVRGGVQGVRRAVLRLPSWQQGLHRFRHLRGAGWVLRRRSPGGKLRLGAASGQVARGWAARGRLSRSSTAPPLSINRSLLALGEVLHALHSALCAYTCTCTCTCICTTTS
jgi:hypothetical protein